MGSDFKNNTGRLNTNSFGNGFRKFLNFGDTNSNKARNPKFDFDSDSATHAINCNTMTSRNGIISTSTSSSNSDCTTTNTNRLGNRISTTSATTLISSSSVHKGPPGSSTSKALSIPFIVKLFFATIVSALLFSVYKFRVQKSQQWYAEQKKFSNTSTSTVTTVTSSSSSSKKQLLTDYVAANYSEAQKKGGDQ